MAAKSKKRLHKIENKLLKLEKLEIGDIICTICQSILIEPVTLPCFHDFCLRCFNGSVENNALCCPLCRLRIGSWLRTATKQKSLVNIKLWNFIQNKFSKDIEKKLRGEDNDFPTETPIPRLSEPGAIRSEYEAELKRLREERLRLEEKQFYETELLIRKIRQEEEEAQKKYLERLKQDETLAKQIQGETQKQRNKSDISNKKNLKDLSAKIRLKPMKIDNFLTKVTMSSEKKLNIHKDKTPNQSPVATALNKTSTNVSPEMLPSYGRLLKNFLNKKVKPETNVWNKENGETKADDHSKLDSDDTGKEKSVVKTKNGMHSLLVSLPLPSTRIVQSNKNVTEHRNIETGSVDSMQQELCYFKPIEITKPTSLSLSKGLPIRVPILRIETDGNNLNKSDVQPSREKYLEGLCRLRHISLSQKLPSAFVIALKLLRSSREEHTPTNTKPKLKMKKKSSHSSQIPQQSVLKSSKTKHMVDGIIRLDNEPSLRRTRSMGSISKDESEVTPKKKIKVNKSHSDKKPYLRSNSKKMNVKRQSCSPVLFGESINNNKVNLAVKNLSSPLENCDVKNILHEQLRIERMIEQEKNDLELARKMDAEWNGRRQLRRPATKRQVTMNYALRPAKKLKV